MAKLIGGIILALAVLSLSGCMLAAAGVGAAAGYKAHEEGYRLQKPVRKDEQW